MKDVAFLAGVPFPDQLLGAFDEAVAVRLERAFLKRAHHEPAMALVLFAVHAQQPAGKPSLRRVLGPADREELRLKDFGIAQHALVVLGTEYKDEALAVLLEGRNRAMVAIQAAHARERVARKIEEPAKGHGQRLPGRNGVHTDACACHPPHPLREATPCSASPPGRSTVLSANRRPIFGEP